MRVRETNKKKEDTQIEVKNLVKDYRRKRNNDNLKKSIGDIFNPKYEKFRAVDDISFSVKRGESVGYVGPNGSGKSTTIKMLSGILTPTSGIVNINGREPYKKRIENNREIGVVFGNRSLLWWDVPVIESYRLFQKLYEIPEKQFQENLEKCKEVMGIGSLLNIPERQLSLGQKMRCNIAAAFLHNPQIVYLDEPTIGLDVDSKQKIRAFIKQINEEKQTTFLVTSHDFQDIEALCKRIILINKGKVIIDSDIENIRKEFTEFKRINIELKGNVENVIKCVNWQGMLLKGYNKYHLMIEYRPEEKNPIEIMTEISKYGEIKDISIMGQDIESIIQRIVKEQS